MLARLIPTRRVLNESSLEEIKELSGQGFHNPSVKKIGPELPIAACNKLDLKTRVETVEHNTHLGLFDQFDQFDCRINDLE